MTREDYNKLRTLQAKKNKADLAEFKKMLDNHDWHWRMSDSRTVRERGEKEEEAIKSFLIGRGQRFHTTYQKKFDRIYKKFK